MTQSPAQKRGDDELLFDAVLTPHRSLSPRGFLILMLLVCGISFAAGVAFYLAGAWPVIGFLGLDVLLIYGAFKLSYRSGRMHESLRLTRGALVVERVEVTGEARSWRFQPTWLQVLIDDPPGHESHLTLRSHGRNLVIGDFLTPEERLDLAKALREALSRLRCLPGKA